MVAITWDGVGQRFYETGVDHGVLYPFNPTNQQYDKGVAWNGLTTVTPSPSGAEANPFYADNIKYLNLLSAEEFGCTIEAYTYPDEFALCDGSASPEDLGGVYVGQQARKAFGFAWRTKVGNDVDADNHGHKLHIMWNALASPSEKAYNTVNDSPEPITFSWETTTTPVPFSDPKYASLRPTAYICLDSRKCDKKVMDAAAKILYGDISSDAKLPATPEEFLKELAKATAEKGE